MADSVVVKLLDRVLHEGRVYQADEEIKVLAHDAERLVAGGYAELKKSGKAEESPKSK